MEQKELEEIIANHVKWLLHKRGCKRADLSKEDVGHSKGG